MYRCAIGGLRGKVRSLREAATRCVAAQAGRLTTRRQCSPWLLPIAYGARPRRCTRRPRPTMRRFLRSVFQMARSGIHDELAEYPDELRGPLRLHREEAVFDTLLAALDSGSLVVSGDLRCVLSDLAETIDRANEYERVVAEHAALLGLRRQVCEGSKR